MENNAMFRIIGIISYESQPLDRNPLRPKLALEKCHTHNGNDSKSLDEFRGSGVLDCQLSTELPGVS